MPRGWRNEGNEAPLPKHGVAHMRMLDHTYSEDLSNEVHGIPEGLLSNIQSLPTSICGKTRA